jgi:hypothetical protein
MVKRDLATSLHVGLHRSPGRKLEFDLHGGSFGVQELRSEHQEIRSQVLKRICPCLEVLEPD